MKIKFLPIALGITVICISCAVKEKKNQPEYKKISNSILIVYTSGNPSKTLSDFKPEEIDAVSAPTPSVMNVELISQSLVNKFNKSDYTVHLKKTSEITDYRELLQYDMLILGTPTYFWNMNWEMKKMMDECFEKIYVARRDDFKRLKNIVFVMGENGTCVGNAIRQMEYGFTDCSGKLNASMTFLTGQTMQLYDDQISRLAFVADSVMKVQ